MKRLNGQSAGSAARRARTGGFSLVEVLLAIFILSIGLIMVASIFPVGAEWTRQNTEETLAQEIAKNALSIVRSRMNASDFSNITGTSTLQGAQGFLTKVLPSERAYQYGATKPFPVATPTNATYFWTMVARQSPSLKTTAWLAPTFDVYIVVFKKGGLEQTFTQSAVSNTRANGEIYIPCLVSAAYAPGGGSPITLATPPMGASGIGVQSGTVFRQIIGLNGSSAAPRPMLVGTPDTSGAAVNVTEAILWAPPADGAGAGSPLVYVYQTTLSF